MPTKYRITLKDPKSEQRRYVTLSHVTCPGCLNDPIARGGFELPNGRRVSECRKCDGTGEVPASRESAAAFLEDMEREYVRFRLDEDQTLLRYPTIPDKALEIVENTVRFVPKDTHTVDNRFLRAGKVIRNPRPDQDMPGYQRAHRGWMAFHHQEEPFKVMEVGDTGLKAAVTGFVYGVPVKNQYDGTAVSDWDTDTQKVSLHTAYTVDIDTHDFFNDVSGTEVTGTNYTAGGATLGTKTATYDTATDQARLDSADPSWASSTISATDSITYKSTGTASTSPLLCSLDFGATVSTTAGTFLITVDSTGWFVVDCT